MTKHGNYIAAIGASCLVLALYSSLSIATAKILLRIWLICGTLFLMARLSDLRRGVRSGYGRLPLSTVAALALWSAVIGLLAAVAIVVFATMAAPP